MTAPSQVIRTTLTAFVLCLSAVSQLLGAVTTAVLPPPPAPAQTSEDPGAWRREPFLGISQKNNRKAAPLTRGTFRPNVKSAISELNQDLQLQGIMQADRSYYALINGQTVKTGDSIAGVTIKEISRFRVVTVNSHKQVVTYDIYQGRINRGKQ
jgi:hypothetical protein